MCEAIRRRRNLPQWGKGSSSTATRADQALELLECWGIGAKKCEEPDGYAWGLLHVLDENDALLAPSRAVVAHSAAAVSASAPAVINFEQQQVIEVAVELPK